MTWPADLGEDPPLALESTAAGAFSPFGSKVQPVATAERKQRRMTPMRADNAKSILMTCVS